MVKALIFQGLPRLLQAVTKISAVYKFHEGHVAADDIGAGNFKG